jgi:CRISPR-associated protein Cmr6
MNAKYQFYQHYYQQVDLRKFKQEKKREDIEKRNEQPFKTASANMIAYKVTADAQSAVNLEPYKEKLRGWTQISLKTTYPGLFLGSGYNHETGNIGEFKLGFFFDHTSGLPTIPGSSVKGVLRSVFPQFKKITHLRDLEQASTLQKHKAQYVAELADLPGAKQAEPTLALLWLIHRLEMAIFEGCVLSTDDTGKVISTTTPMLLHDRCLDAYPNVAVNKPIFASDVLTPHGKDPLKNPKPLPFLKVMPHIRFEFCFLLHDLDLGHDTVFDVARKRKLFEAILREVGVGAKTNVGYGQLIHP